MIAAAIAVTFPQTIDVPAHSKAHSDLFAHRATVLDVIHNRNFALALELAVSGRDEVMTR